MATVDIRTERKRAKKRICRELKRLGITKKEVALRTSYHYNTVKNALNAEHPDWSDEVIAATQRIIDEKC